MDVNWLTPKAQTRSILLIAMRDPVIQEKDDGWFSPYLTKRIASLPTR